jgi:hypothetical protein
MCGDGECSADEVNSCPQDCGNPVGSGSGSGSAKCGDFVCQGPPNGTEDATNCPQDCGSGSGSGNGSGCGVDCNDPNTLLGCFLGTCTDATLCATCLAGGSGSGSGACNFDGMCEAGETMASCPTDNCPM